MKTANPSHDSNPTHRGYAPGPASYSDDGTSKIVDATVDEARMQAHAFERQGRAQAQQLAEEGKRELNRAARSALDTAADRLESLASNLRHEDPASLLSRGERLARENPALFFAGAAVAGIALSRFIKASGEARRRQDQQLEQSGRQETAPGIPSQNYDAPPALPSRPLEVPATSSMSASSPVRTGEFSSAAQPPLTAGRTWETD